VKLILTQLLRKFSTFHGSCTFITALRWVHHRCLPLGVSHAHILLPYCFKHHFNIILPTPTFLCGLFSSKFPKENSVYIPHLSHTSHMPWPLHFIIPTIFSEQYKLWSSLLCSYMQPAVTFSPYGCLGSNEAHLCKYWMRTTELLLGKYLMHQVITIWYHGGK